jgi:hypothetical protein
MSENLFEMASQVLQFEQKFLGWQCSLPATMVLVDQNFLTLGNSHQEVLRYRFILTVRFLNLRILAHRPVLCKYLEFIGTVKPDAHQLAVLRQVGGSSLQICAESALTIIALMRAVLTLAEPPRHLLGAWWFSLYYSMLSSFLFLYTLRGLIDVQHSMQR